MGNADQTAVVDLAKQANNRGGMSTQEARAMVEWAKELGIKVRIDPPHTKYPFTHMHLGPVNNIPICE